MDSSRMLLHCLEQLQISSHGCLRQQRLSQARGLLRNKQGRCSSMALTRCFGTTRTQQQDNPSPPGSSRTTAETMQKGAESVQNMPQNPLRQSTPPASSSTPRNPPSINVNMLNQRSSNQLGRTQLKDSLRTTTSDALNALVDEQLRKKKEAGSRWNMDQWSAKGSIFQRTPNPSKPSSQDPTRTPNFVDMMGMVPSRDPAGTSDLGPLKKAERPLRLKPTLGRTVTVDDDRNLDLTRAFVALETRINSRGNAVRRDERLQRFHVRRGQAKKIKRRERWRIMFKEGFLAECARIRKMIRQGW